MNSNSPRDSSRSQPHILVRGVELLAHAGLVCLVVGLGLNALMIGGVPAAVIGIIVGQSVEAWLLSAGISSVVATAAMWMTVIVVWAVPTIPGFLILDAPHH